jgi:chromosome segregation ATPase
VREHREDLGRLEEENAKLVARIRELRDKVRQIETDVGCRVRELTRDLETTVNTAEAQLRDKERAMVEQLWVDSLSADLKVLLEKVPTAQGSLTNGVSDCLKRLALPREG